MLLPLTNEPRDYPWGSRSLLAELEGRPIAAGPEAEVWFGDHPADPAEVADGSGRTLDRWLDEEAGGIRLPYLLKLLAAAHPLSIQAHPSKAQAAAGFAREERAGVPRDAVARSYRDDNHKPELIVAVSDGFRALVGLRERDATLRLLASLGDAPGVGALRARLEGRDAEAALAAAVPWLLSPEAAVAAAELVGALAAARSDEFADELAVVRWLSEEAPGDPGVAVALLMNVVTLRRGEGVFVPAGVLHAYFEGLGVEIMAASDNVLRGGLTGKHVDVAELSAVLRAAPGPVAVLAPVPVSGAVGDVAAYPTPVADFALTRMRADAGPATTPAPRGLAIALATAGAPVLSQGGDVLELRPGRAALVTPSREPLRVDGEGELFVAQAGTAAS